MALPVLRNQAQWAWGKARGAGSRAANASRATAKTKTAGRSSGGMGWKGKAAIGGGVGVAGIMAGRSMSTGRPADRGPQSLYGPPTNRGQYY
jgi:hypothetical protein